MEREITNIPIRRVKELGFYMNESLYKAGPENVVNIQLGAQLGHDVSQNLVLLFTRIFYHYIDSPSTDILADIQVQTIFEIEELSQFLVSDMEIKLPPLVISEMVGASFSHSRALLSNNLAGTYWQENYLELISCERLARHFFPSMFEGHATKAKASKDPIKRGARKVN